MAHANRDEPTSPPRTSFSTPEACRVGPIRIALDRGSKPTWVCSRRDLNPCQKLERLLSLATRLRERGHALTVGPT